MAVIAGVASAVPASAATGWVLQTTANPAAGTLNTLDSVSCTSASNCVSVGNYQNSAGDSYALAERWNGSTWALKSLVSPTLAWMSGVSCSATTNCEAVGHDSAGTLAEHWNGSTWSTQTVPAAVSGLTAVDCLSATFCEATLW